MWLDRTGTPPTAYCDFAIGWKEQHISVLGGSYGTSPANVKRMRENLF